MRIPIYFIFIFIALLKNADASEPISHTSRKAVYNIVIKPDLIIKDRIKHFNFEDIVLEYQTLCEDELSAATQEVVVKDIQNTCEISMKALYSLKTPKSIARYERYIKQRLLSNNSEYVTHEVCKAKDSQICQLTNRAATMADYSLKVIFYPLKALMTGDFNFN